MEIKIRVKDCKLKGVQEFESFQGNLKSLSKEGKQKLKQSILRNGFNAPIFIWKNSILDGHQRLICIKELLKEGHTIENGNYLPYVEIEADNKKQAGELILTYNSQYAAITYEGLQEFTQDFELDLNDMKEITNLNLDMDELIDPPPLDDPPPPEVEHTNIQLGDIFEIDGKHKIYCADSTKVELTEEIQILLTDPPYGINIVNVSGTIGGSTKVGFKRTASIGGDGIVEARHYRPVIGDDKGFDPSFLLKYGKKQFIFGGNHFAAKLPNNSHWLVWDKKPEGGLEDTFSDAELVWTNIKDKKTVKVYRHLWAGLLREGKRDVELLERVHPTQKPVGLLYAILRDYSEKDDLIYDPFLGSGSTLVAADQLNRKCVGVEIDPLYVSVIQKRYKQLKPKAVIKCLNREFNVDKELEPTESDD
jgi:16S rRNA G966 N2-methylase RsmD